MNSKNTHNYFVFKSFINSYFDILLQNCLYLFYVFGSFNYILYILFYILIAYFDFLLPILMFKHNILLNCFIGNLNILSSTYYTKVFF